MGTMRFQLTHKYHENLASVEVVLENCLAAILYSVGEKHHMHK